MDPVTEPHPSPSNSNYAFITHSQETLPRNLPPSIDNANLARRRRRRTSVHDQAILEEEYRICDRPDKTRRKEISSRVQMGEKEVQIWFQNKRQSARRKAKPLLPHEIIPNTTTTTTNNSNNNSSQQSSSQQEEYSQQGMMMPSSSQYSSFDNSQQSLSREDIRHMSTSFNSDSHQHRRRRCVSVSSGIDFGSPQPQCLADRGSFSSDVSASQESARSKSQPIYLGLSDADPDEDFDDDDDIGEEEAEEEELRLRGRNTVESPHHHLPQHRYEPSYYSKRQKLSSRDNHLLALLQQSSPPTTSSIPTQESQHQQNPSLSSRNDQPEPEMTTSAHQRLQDVLSSMQEIISSSSTPAKPTFTNSRRTNANPNANANPGHNPNPNPTPTTPRLLKRTSSIRLSTSLEGKATIVLDEEPESPPSSQQTLPTPKKPSPIAGSGPPRKIVDSKIWEFYCDNQAMIRSPATHASLQTAAEAKEALGLLRRKNSHNSKLPPTLPQSSPVAHRKRGGKLAQPSSPTKAKKSRKILSAKLSRSKAVLVAKRSGSGKKLVDGLPSELGQESDKENRPPGAPVSPPPEPRGRGGKGEAKRAPAEKPSRKRKRNTIAADERRILEDHKTIPSQTSAVYYVPSSSQPIDNFRSDGPGLDEHEMMLSQRSFSNYFTSSQESGPAVMDEMECVENLLSLRGGTWR